VIKIAYATTKQFAERGGLGVRIIDETVGTGAGTTTAIQAFDLDNDNIISGTYTLNHAPSTTSGTFPALTETVDYSVDKESGRITTTGSGAAVLGTDTLFATYTYVESFSDTVISNMLDNATTQVDKITGKRWTSGTTTTEYRNGRRNPTSMYPTTDGPYTSDWDQPDQIVLKQWPITKIDHVFFLANPQSITKFFNFNSGSSAYVDWTDNVNSSTEAPFTLFGTNPITNDIVYIGSGIPFLGLDVNLSTVGVDGGSTAIDWEYWNGSAWADITETDSDSGASLFTASGKFTWTYPWGWDKTTVNSQSLYWIRGKLTDNYTTDPICATLAIQDAVSTILEPRQISFKDNGILNFMGVQVPDGQLNVRIDYSYGMSSTPSYIEELTVLLAAIQAYVHLSGGSFDDATSYTLGSKAITIGEAWVNIREVLDQIKKRVKEILDMIGKRADISVI
jgi:hypothetical protein